MRTRALKIALLLTCWLAGCVANLGPQAEAQLRAAPVAQAARAERAQDATSTTIVLDLCVDGSAAYPCPANVDNDFTFYAALTYVYGQNLDGVIRVSNASTGTITVFDNGVAICSLALGTGASCPAASTNFNVGVHVLTATFTSPDPSLVADSTSQPVTVTVTQDAITGVTLASSLNPAPEGTAVTFTAGVAAANDAVPTGQVSFSDGTLVLATVALDANGKAAFTTATLTVGTHQINATYPGAQNFSPAPSPGSLEEKITPVIAPSGTATTLVSSVNPSTVGENVTFTAEVGTTGPFIGSPGGAVTFRDGTAAFATVIVNEGSAKTNISTLAAGTHNVTASYSGDASTAASTSKVLVQQVDYPLTQLPPGYTITVTPSPVKIGVGLTANLVVTVTPVSGFSAPVTLACTQLPHEGACTFGQTLIPAGGGMTTLDLTTMAPHDCGSSVPYYVGDLRTPVGLRGVADYLVPSLAGVFVLLLPRRRRRRWLKSLLAMVVVCGLAGFSGCSSRCTDFGTIPGSYTFNVVGTTAAVEPVTAGTTPGGPAGAVSVTASVGLTVLY